MRNYREELEGHNFDNGTLEFEKCEVNFNTDTFTVKSETEAFDFDMADFDNVVETVEIIEG